MTIEEIVETRQELERELNLAFSNMTLNTNIPSIYQRLKNLQNLCPHTANFSVCPYCGKEKGE